jgi:hypothetical protein
MSANQLYDASNTSKYINNGHATWYIQEVGAHKWMTAPSGTAGNTISFTQAMTLNASGNLMLGTTSLSNPPGFVRVLNVSGADAALVLSNSSGTAKNWSIGALDSGSLGIFDATAARLTISSAGVATFTGDVKVKTLEVTNVGTDSTSSGVSTYMRITVNGQNYLIPLHGTP